MTRSVRAPRVEDSVATFADLVPAHVAVHELTAADRLPAALVEEDHLPGAVAAGRRAEFAAGRFCARRALAQLGVNQAAIPVGAHRQPVWPTTCVGSITHCAELVAAAAASSSRVCAIGIDAEVHRPLPARVGRAVMGDEEEKAAGIVAAQPIHARTVIFSAKESVYKAWFALTGQRLGFRDAEVYLDPTSARSGEFEAVLLVPAPQTHSRRIDRLVGRYVCTDHVIRTAVVVAAFAQGEPEP